mgnify:FL=1
MNRKLDEQSIEFIWLEEALIKIGISVLNTKRKYYETNTLEDAINKISEAIKKIENNSWLI